MLLYGSINLEDSHLAEEVILSLIRGFDARYLSRKFTDAEVEQFPFPKEQHQFYT
jgi:hypothetical protein